MFSLSSAVVLRYSNVSFKTLFWKSDILDLKCSRLYLNERQQTFVWWEPDSAPVWVHQYSLIVFLGEFMGAPGQCSMWVHTSWFAGSLCSVSFLSRKANDGVFSSVLLTHSPVEKHYTQSIENRILKSRLPQSPFDHVSCPTAPANMSFPVVPNKSIDWEETRLMHEWTLQ